MNRKIDLIDRLNKYIAANENGNVSQQQNAFAAMDVFETVSALNEMQGCKLARKIAEVEAYDPAADKYGFGPVTVSPVDFAAFID